MRANDLSLFHLHSEIIFDKIDRRKDRQERIPLAASGATHLADRVQRRSRHLVRQPERLLFLSDFYSGDNSPCQALVFFISGCGDFYFQLVGPFPDALFDFQVSGPFVNNELFAVFFIDLL